MYAIIETGGKQYKVESGDVIFVEKLDTDVDTSITFDKIVAVHDDKELILGSPVVEGATVLGTVLKNGKGKKINVFTYRPKKGSKRALGHRQPYTKIQIGEINPTTVKAAAKTKAATKAAKEDSKADDQE